MRLTLLLAICFFLLLIGSALLIRIFLLFIVGHKTDIQSLSIIAGLVFTLATAIFSIHSSMESLKQAENLALFQVRPFIALEAMGVQVLGETDGTNTHCVFSGSIKNYGHNAAKLGSDIVQLSFKNEDGKVIRLSSNPVDGDVIKIQSSSKNIVVGGGTTARSSRTDFWVKDKDAEFIKKGLTPFSFKITIPYSMAGFKKVWEYDIEGQCALGKETTILHEEEREADLQ